MTATASLEPHFADLTLAAIATSLPGATMIAQPIAMMLTEHDDHGAHLRELEALTSDFSPPDDACPTWRALYVGSRKLADDLMEPIHTENNVLFTRFLG